MIMTIKRYSSPGLLRKLGIAEIVWEIYKINSFPADLCRVTCSSLYSSIAEMILVHFYFIKFFLYKAESYKFKNRYLIIQ